MSSCSAQYVRITRFLGLGSQSYLGRATRGIWSFSRRLVAFVGRAFDPMLPTKGLTVCGDSTGVSRLLHANAA